VGGKKGDFMLQVTGKKDIFKVIQKDKRTFMGKQSGEGRAKKIGSGKKGSTG